MDLDLQVHIFPYYANFPGLGSWRNVLVLIAILKFKYDVIDLYI